jgi:hypothetical protein
MYQLSNTERRAFRRKEAKRTTKATCRRGALGLGPDLALAVANLSQAGICLAVRAPLESREEVEVTLEALGSHRPVRVMAEVIWCAADPGGGHRIGARFQSHLSFPPTAVEGGHPG